MFTLQCFPIKDTVREIENAEKEIGLIILINAVFFLYFMIMIKLAIMALIEENVAYSLNEKGISLTYKGKIKRTYRWERMKTKRIYIRAVVLWVRGLLRDGKTEMNVQFFVLEKLKILYGSRHSHQKHGVKKYRCAVPLFRDYHLLFRCGVSYFRDIARLLSFGQIR